MFSKLPIIIKEPPYRAASTHLLIYELTQRWGW